MKRELTAPRILAFPAPRSESVELPNGRYFNRPWTLAGVQQAIEAGMWFEPTSRHEFQPHSGARLLATKHFSRLPRDQFGRIIRGSTEQTPVRRVFQQGRGRGAQ
jgi:hypothetical protein